jgi:hypothetical protein
MPLVQDIQEMETGAQLILLAVAAFIVYSIYDATTNPNATWLSSLWDNLIGAAPLGSGPQGSTPTTPFWADAECLITLGATCGPQSFAPTDPDNAPTIDGGGLITNDGGSDVTSSEYVGGG